MRVRKKRYFTGTLDTKPSSREMRNREVARLAAAEGIVLLENKGQMLPLEKGEKVALYGAGASRTIKGGTGSGDVNERECVSIFQGMENAGFDITNREWVEAFDREYCLARSAWRDQILEKAGDESGVEFFDTYIDTPFVMPKGGPIVKTEADTAFYILSRVAGEGADRWHAPGDYLLTEEEHGMLEDICRCYPRVAVVINTGGLVDLSFMDEFQNICALLYIVQPGMEGGNAFADVISGDIVPSGKLTDSWAYQYSDYPNSAGFSHNDGEAGHERYTEGIYVGYRYFDTFQVPVRYSFGYGLSYTEFDKTLVWAEWNKNTGCLGVTVEAANKGTVYTGKQVIQLYVTCPEGKLDKEFRRLAAFAKTECLTPGQKQSVHLEIPLHMLASFHEEMSAWILEKGSYVLWLGDSLLSSSPAAVVELDREVVLTKTRHIAPLQEELVLIHSSREDSARRMRELMEEVSRSKLPVIPIAGADIPTEEISYRQNREFVSEESLRFAESLSVEKLIALASGDPDKGSGGNLGAAGIAVPGSAGETSDCALEDNLASIVLADGPAGLRLMKYYNVQNGKILPKPFSFSLEGGIFCPDRGDEPGERYYQYCTAIPVGTLLAQSWDISLIRRVGEMIAQEMEEFGVTLWLAPGMNIHRNPLCGRNFEYYSEDPLLSGKIAAAMTDGVQSVAGCGTTIKHLTCNNQEDKRMDSDSVVSERALREIYLKGFEIAVKESQPMAIMTSYNLLNGVHLANSHDICTDVVRSEWGFEGLIMTDWTTTEKGPSCTAAGCMRAGNDLIMPGAPCDRASLQTELENGALCLEDLTACISRIIHIVWQSNQYEGAAPYRNMRKEENNNGTV